MFGSVVRVAAASAMLLTGTAWPATADSDPPVTDRCAVPPELLDDGASFSDLTDPLRQGQPVVIVAIGGASTRGIGPIEQSYPARLQVELSHRYPTSRIQVINLGVPRESAMEMLRRLPRDVLPLKPQLVIWETGTNDAVAGVTLDDFAQALKDGVELLRGAGIDVLLMDMQYSRQSVEVINFERYMETMQGIAEAGNARLFKRYTIMKYWSETGAFEFDGPRAGRQELAAQVYDCIGRRLADAIVAPAP